MFALCNCGVPPSAERDRREEPWGTWCGRGRRDRQRQDAAGRSGGIGRGSTPAAEGVSDDLRRHGGELLDRRRRTAALSLVAAGAMGVVAAYQNGLVRRLPEPPLPFFDAEQVDASGEAYALFRTPDAALGLVSVAMVPQVMPEARLALRRLLGR